MQSQKRTSSKEEKEEEEESMTSLGGKWAIAAIYTISTVSNG
jgi:hypothetical protein